MDSTLLAHASAEQWQALDDVLDNLPDAHRLAILAAVFDSRQEGVEPTLEEICALADLVSGHAICPKRRRPLRKR